MPTADQLASYALQHKWIGLAALLIGLSVRLLPADEPQYQGRMVGLTIHYECECGSVIGLRKETRSEAPTDDERKRPKISAELDRIALCQPPISLPLSPSSIGGSRSLRSL